MKKAIKNFITNGIIIYFSIILAYVLFFFLMLYFTDKLNNVHDAYVVAMNLIAILNLNIMSVVFIKRFNKISKQIDDLNYALTYEDEEE